jgi:hypothetical protein
MNERIDDLFVQARFDAGSEKQFNATMRDVYHKFAELLIRECADICINENVSNLDLKVMRESGKFTVQDLATKSCAENLAKRIKERFGILDQEN